MGENPADGANEQTVKFWTETQEVAEGQDENLCGMKVQPLTDLHQNGLSTDQTTDTVTVKGGMLM